MRGSCVENVIELWPLENTKSRYTGLTKDEEGGEDIHSWSIFSQFQTAIKSDLNWISLRGKRDPPRIDDLSNRVECKPRMEMGKMAGNGAGILDLLTVASIKF